MVHTAPLSHCIGDPNSCLGLDVRLDRFSILQISLGGCEDAGEDEQARGELVVELEHPVVDANLDITDAE